MLLFKRSNALHEYLWTDYNDNVTNIWHWTIFEKYIYTFVLWYYLLLLHVNAYAFAVHATQTSKAAL